MQLCLCIRSFTQCWVLQTENHLKAALLNAPDLNPGGGAPPQQASQLEAQLSMQSQTLHGPIADVLALYAAAFRADAAQTDSMARRLVHAVSSAHGTAAADKALRLPEELTRSLAQSIKRFLSIVTVRPRAQHACASFESGHSIVRGLLCHPDWFPCIVALCCTEK